MAALPGSILGECLSHRTVHGDSFEDLWALFETVGVPGKPTWANPPFTGDFPEIFTIKYGDHPPRPDPLSFS